MPTRRQSAVPRNPVKRNNPCSLFHALNSILPRDLIRSRHEISARTYTHTHTRTSYTSTYIYICRLYTIKLYIHIHLYMCLGIHTDAINNKLPYDTCWGSEGRLGFECRTQARQARSFRWQAPASSVPAFRHVAEGC